MRDVDLIGGFYKSKSLPFSAQDLVNWLPVPSKSDQARSPMKLRGLPGIAGINPPIVVIEELSISGNAPNTEVGATYSYSYSAAGGTPPYTFVLASGTLPAGLSMSSAGVITGTPTTGETRTFTVRVIDSQAQQAELEDTIVVSVVQQVYWRTTQTGGRVLSHNVLLPDEAVEGDWLMVFTLCEYVNAGFFIPSSGSFTQIDFGNADVTGAYGYGFLMQATASHITSGIPVSIQDTASPQASNGAFTVYAIRENIVATTPIVSSDSANFVFDPPSVTNAFGTATVINFASVQTTTTAVIQTMPYEDGQQTVTLTGATMAICFQIASNTGTTNPGAFTFTGSNVFTSANTNVLEGNP